MKSIVITAIKFKDKWPDTIGILFFIKMFFIFLSEINHQSLIDAVL